MILLVVIPLVVGFGVGILPFMWGSIAFVCLMIGYVVTFALMGGNFSESFAFGLLFAVILVPLFAVGYLVGWLSRSFLRNA